MKEPKITESEWMAELDRCRHKPPQLTEEQWRLVDYGRDNDSPVEWKYIVELLKKKYNISIAINTLRGRYESRKGKEE